MLSNLQYDPVRGSDDRGLDHDKGGVVVTQTYLLVRIGVRFLLLSGMWEVFVIEFYLVSEFAFCVSMS